MKKIAVIVASVGLFSCGGNNMGPDKDPSLKVSEEFQQQNEAATKLNDSLAKMIQVNSTAVPTNDGNLSATLNPAHGQPGHRCDLAVGAPLNNAPAAQPQQAQPVQVTTPVPTTPAATTPATTVAPGTNPPHGQPGHRCDIGVGEPLTSAPTQAVQTPVTATPVVNSTPAITPITSGNTGAVAAGTNPAHGQPGHRCDLAVGAPLQ